MKEITILDNINKKLGIADLNELQLSVKKTSADVKDDLIILAPTGSGKTIAYAIPLLKAIKAPTGKVQAVIMAPSRELVIQISQVVSTISTGLKISLCYGGHNMLDEKQSLSVTPDVIISTPGRLLDHLHRKNVSVESTKYLIIDEYDKSLELGFQDEMEKILKRMPNLSRKILTSATSSNDYPMFLNISNPKIINFLNVNNDLSERLTILETKAPDKDKLATLLLTLRNIKENKPVIVFANHRESVERIFQFLKDNNIPVGLYHGGLEQIEREKAIEMFNNGSYKVLVSTDLGARGLDIDNIFHVIHYHLPVNEETFTHRNGRSARIMANGIVHVITSPFDRIPKYINFDSVEELCKDAKLVLNAEFKTLYIQAGKKEKISKGDIVGFLIKSGNLAKDEIGTINSHDHYSLVAISSTSVAKVLKNINGLKIKNQKVKISLAKF